MASLSLVTLLVAILHFTHLASSEPTVSFPINSQLPPVARVDELFSYIFSSSTFKSDSGGTLTYSLGDAPKWLSLDSSQRRLYGTPTNETVASGDVVGQSVEVIADDGSGTVTLNATLVVSREAGPSVKIPISEQIENFGNYSAPSSLLSYPSTTFSYTFDNDTFSYQPDMINYYATSSDSSPLPAWIQFDDTTLTFSGTTPPVESLVQPPQTFGFSLIASDIVGFSAVEVSFAIVVGSHKLTTDNPVITLNATRGKELSYSGLADGVSLDGSTAQPGNLNVTTEDLPDWLTLDTDTWDIQGTPGKNDTSTNFTINFSDSYSDTLDVAVVVNVATTLFESTPGDINVKAGGKVDIDLASYFWNPSDINIGVSVAPEKTWLNVDGFNITGKVPMAASGKLKVTIQAGSKTSDLNETESFNIDLVAVTASPTSTATETSMTATETSATASQQSTGTASTSEDNDPSSVKGLSTGELLLAIMLPVIFVLLLVMLLACWCMRRRKEKRGYLSNRFRRKISGPVMNSLRVNGNKPAMQESVKAFDVSHGERQLGSQHSDQTPSSFSSLPTPELPSGFLTEESGARLAATPTAEDGRQSWITVEGTVAATARRSQVSLRSVRSDTTFPESTHELLPPPSFLTESGGNSFRSGLELAIPSLEDLPGLRLGNSNQSQTNNSSLSTSKDSTLGFSSSHGSSPRLITGLFGKKTSERVVDSRPQTRDEASGLSEATDSVPELRRPDLARVSSQQMFSRPTSRAWYDTDSSNGSRSFGTDPSFGSSENWRVIGGSQKAAPASMSYSELVDTAPFHPNRPSTAMGSTAMGPGRPTREGAQPGERASSELMSPSQWGDARTSIRASVASKPEVVQQSTTGFSKLGEELTAVSSGVSGLGESSSGAFGREDSGRTEGSFKAFL